LFNDVEDEKAGVNYYYRKVLGGTADRPGKEELVKIPANTPVEDVYDQIKSKGDFKSPEEGIQLVKVIGDVNPEKITEHMNEAKNSYDKMGDDGSKQEGTTVQCVSTTAPNKEGKKEPVKYIKATRGKKKQPTDEPISYYKVKGDKDVRDILDQIQEKGKPDGKDGVDYETVKPDELPKVQKLFDNDKDIPKTYYYTSDVKGDGQDKNGKPYESGKIQSVTVLSDPNNKTNKNYQILDVFRKADEQNQRKKPVQDNATYYYTKTLGDLLNKDTRR